MPGRTSTRSGRQSTARVSRKGSTQTLNGRSSTASRNSTPQVVIPQESPSSVLRTKVCGFFADAQRTTAGHRKLVINLRKLQESCCYEPTSGAKTTKGALREFDEERFGEEVARCVVALMGVKKSEPVGDRVVRYLGLFLKYAGEKDNAILAELSQEDADAIPDTPSSRLSSRILSLLLPLLTSKEKTVRYRATQLISHIINSVDSIDDDLFQLLRLGLLRRIRDKESMVRVQAVLGLGRLAGNEADGDQNEDDSDDDDASGLLGKLLEVLQNDPSADVRRSLLLNLPLTQVTLPFLLERARDQDPATRRALYSRLLPALGDFRHLSLSMREKLLRWGLRDRDDNVRKATGKLFRERWIEDCAGTRGPDGELPTEASPPSFEGLQELLERIDVVNSGGDNGIALEAMKQFWEGRPDYRDDIVFNEDFWNNLTAESVFTARTFNSFCRYEGEGRYESLVEEKMPEITRFAFCLQLYINKLVEGLRKVPAEGEADEEDTVELEFIVEQLLHMAMTLDYTDEVGRRKTYALLRETLAIPELPEEVTKLVIVVLRGLCGSESAGEREFCGLVLEAIAEVHDTIMDNGPETDESFHSARSEISGDTTPTRKSKSSNGRKSPSADGESSVNEEEEEEKAIKEIMINMKCLHIAQCMLENVEEHLQSNVHLVTMLNNLVVPAVRSHEAPIRERGLLCLGLCCLLDKTLAEENLTLFLHCFSKGHPALQVYALNILSDIILSHSAAVISSPSSMAHNPNLTDHSHPKSIYRVFAKALKADDRPDVQAAAATALCKLLLAGVLTYTDPPADAADEYLKLLVLAYFSPSTAPNLELRQALSYFFPVYCHSRPGNQARMQRIALPALHTLVLLEEELQDSEDAAFTAFDAADADDDYHQSGGPGGAAEMVRPALIAAHLLDWTDPRKLISPQEVAQGSLFSDPDLRRDAAKQAPADVHLDLAADLLDRIADSPSSSSQLPPAGRDEKKILAGMLGKLHVSGGPGTDREKLRKVFDKVVALVDHIGRAATAPTVLMNVPGDASTRNAIFKLHVTLAKAVAREEEIGGGTGTGGGRKGSAVSAGGKERGKEREKVEVDGEGEGEGEGEVEAAGQSTTMVLLGEETTLALEKSGLGRGEEEEDEEEEDEGEEFKKSILAAGREEGEGGESLVDELLGEDEL